MDFLTISHVLLLSDLASDCIFPLLFFGGGILQCNHYTIMSVHGEICLLIIDECIVINHNS